MGHELLFAMPIDIQTFDAAAEAELQKATNSERILRFLAANSDQAFRRGELAERVDIEENSTGPVLNRLDQKGLVRHKGVYWTITDNSDRLMQAEQFQRLTERLNEQDKGFDYDEWRAYAGERPEPESEAMDE